MDFNRILTEPNAIIPTFGERPDGVTCPKCGAENVRGANLCTSCRNSVLPSNSNAVTHGGRRSVDRPEPLAAIAGKRQELIEHLAALPPSSRPTWRLTTPASTC